MPNLKITETKRARTMKNTDEEFVIGPHGEKRPVCDYANAVRVVDILTGRAEEEYVTEEDIKKMRGD